MRGLDADRLAGLQAHPERHDLTFGRQEMWETARWRPVSTPKGYIGFRNEMTKHDQLYGRDYRLGYGLGMLCWERLGFELGLDGQRREHANLNRAGHALVARFTARW